MNASDVFVAFVNRALVPAKAQRYVNLASTLKGQHKILNGLCHEFESAIRENAVCNKDYSKLWDKPCFAFHSKMGFGTEYSKLADAYNDLSIDDSWLIVMRDGTAGIHRPESRWDAEILIRG
jgi:hypothetical protein